MKLIFKSLFFVVVLGLIALTGFAYFGDLSPEQMIVTKPVILDGQ
jgi:hypothetical protein